MNYGILESNQKKNVCIVISLSKPRDSNGESNGQGNSDADGWLKATDGYNGASDLDQESLGCYPAGKSITKPDVAITRIHQLSRAAGSTLELRIPAHRF